MVRRWRETRGRPSTAPPLDLHARDIVDDAIACATQLHAIGEEIDAFRRKGGAALGGEPGPEVDILRSWQDDVLRRFLARAREVSRGDRAALVDARRWLETSYREAHGDLVIGRALEAVEAALRDEEI